MIINGKIHKLKRNEDGAFIIKEKDFIKAIRMKENKGYFYISYVGNKRSENKLIEEFLNLDGINKIVEPFCGSSSFSRWIYANYGDEYNYHSNDIAKGLITWLNDVKMYGCKKYFDYTNEQLKGLTKEKHNENISKCKKEPNEPFNYFYFNKIYNYRRGLYPERLVNKEQDYTKYVHLDEFYKKCNLTCLDYLEYMEKFKNDEGALVYLDPPYFNACNTYYTSIDKIDDEMNIIDNTYMFVYFLKYLQTAKCKIILIINHNSLLVEIYRPYIKLIYNKTYSLSHSERDNKKKKTKHMIVTNIK